MGLDHSRIKELFLRARELELAERTRFLEEECDGDRSLRREVESMLRFEELDPEFLEKPRGELGQELQDLAEAEGGLRQEIAKLVHQSNASSRFDVHGEIAIGGMGRILDVFDNDIGRSLAMKVIRGQEGAQTSGETPGVDAVTVIRFLEEARVTGRLDHPGVVPVHELGVDAEGRVYFTMPLVDGRHLGEIFQKARANEDGWNQTRALGVLVKACEAVAYAHSRGVIHRDLKPNNIMVGNFGEVYVMDWGLARTVHRDEGRDVRPLPVHSQPTDRASTDSPVLTVDGAIIGTPAYMSPEQASGKLDEMGPSSDVYSLGAILYHLLSGKVPYTEGDRSSAPYTILARVQAGPPGDLHRITRDTPQELIAICEKAMARNPEDRYPETQALADDLSAFLEGRVVRAYQTGAIAELKKWIVRNQGMAGSIAAALLVLVAGTIVAWVLKQGSDRNAVLAQEESKRANRERANVLRLSAFNKIEELRQLADSDDYWPPLPDKEETYLEWLGKAEALVAGLHPNPSENDLGHLAQLETLRDRALPQEGLDAEVLAERRAAHPSYSEFEAKRSKLEALKRADEVRSGQSEPASFELDVENLPVEANLLWKQADLLVKPNREIFGQEAEGLAIARLAVERARNPSERAKLSDTLAWALFANGLDQEALEASGTALELADARSAPEFEAYLRRLEAEIESAQGSEGEAQLQELELEVAKLDAEINGRHSWTFAEDGDAWWHEQLETLIAEINAFAAPETGLISGVSADWGWGIERRLEFARAVEERTVSGPRALRAWDEAVRSIANSDRYGGLEIEPQLGLLPIGPDPQSELWEFAHPLSGAVPERDESGELVLTDGMCIILVLLPGGSFDMGGQPRNPSGENYDPHAQPNEGPVHGVELDPFFLSKYELTKGQWEHFAGSDPSYYVVDDIWALRTVGQRNPIENVSWFECQRWLHRAGLTLPTEAQWEYGARAGTPWPWWSGPEKEGLESVANLADAYALRDGAPWRPMDEWLDDGHAVHAPVGSYVGNDFGIHDVYGNVWEWCRDWYGEYGLPVAAGDGERLQTSETARIYRGGCFAWVATESRSARRRTDPPEYLHSTLGVRPARPLNSR